MNEYSVTDTWGDVHNVEPAIRTDDGSRVLTANLREDDRVTVG